MPDLWLTVHGSGSIAFPPFKTRREGVHRITPEEAQLALDWKSQRPDATWVVITPYEPEYVESGELTGTLTPADLRYGTDRAVLVEHEPDDPEAEEDTEPVYTYPCEHCPEEFPSAAILRRHTWMHHSTLAADAEDDARAQLAEDKAERAARERVRTADSAELHPAERTLEDEPIAPRPSLWPKGLGG
jgi:hypothetical protein